jgi:hypothetical protein
MTVTKRFWIVHLILPASKHGQHFCRSNLHRITIPLLPRMHSLLNSRRHPSTRRMLQLHWSTRLIRKFLIAKLTAVDWILVLPTFLPNWMQMLAIVMQFTINTLQC